MFEDQCDRSSSPLEFGSISIDSFLNVTMHNACYPLPYDRGYWNILWPPNGLTYQNLNQTANHHCTHLAFISSHFSSVEPSLTCRASQPWSQTDRFVLNGQIKLMIWHSSKLVCQQMKKSFNSFPKESCSSFACFSFICYLAKYSESKDSVPFNWWFDIGFDCFYRNSFNFIFAWPLTAILSCSTAISYKWNVKVCDIRG